MKIVHLIDYYQPQVGYQEYFLAREHARLGFKTYVVTSDRYFPFPDYDRIYKGILGNRLSGAGEKKEMGINIIRLKSRETPGSNLIFLTGLKNKLTDIKPDLVICHGVYSLTSYLISTLKKDLKFKLIYDNHAAAFNTDFNRSLSRKIYHYFYKTFFAGSIIKNADKIFAIGEAEQDFIVNDLDLQKQQIPIVRLGVDSDLFKFSAQNRKKIRSKYNINDNTPVIVFTGKITPNKDVHVLINALKKLSTKDIVLLLIGNGPVEYLNKLKKSASYTRIIHLPFIENKKLPLYFSASDIAVYPGDFTISVLEAMSCSLPVILPYWSGSSYLDKSGGINSFRRRNNQALFKILSSLVYNKNLIRDFGRRNRNFIRGNYSWEKIAIKTLKLI